MEELLSDPRIHSAVVAALVGFGSWFVKREVKRIDHSLANAVKRDELERLREDMDDRHEENRGDLTEIKEGVNMTHRRIDELYRDLFPGRRQ